MRSIWKLLAVATVVGGLVACEKEKAPTDFSGGCEAVDLGLSVKWASYNVGAQNVEGRGSYFAWGETKEKENYAWETEGDYKWGVYDSKSLPKCGMTKYTADVVGGDGLKKLQPRDDAATTNWGTKWRMPTIDEIKELLDETKCEWTWSEYKKGYTVKGLKTGNSIFLPAVGYRSGLDLDEVGTYGDYWSSSVKEMVPNNADYFYFNSSRHTQTYGRRSTGRSIRAVTEY